MTYQQARRIRNKDYSLSKLITQNIRKGDMSAGGAIKAAFKEKFDVGTRLKAKMTGIKEKFDPLNIAKFLTFGSNVAPALLGRMTGRSKEDIRNFTGGRQTYEDYVKPTATKIGKLEGDDSGLNDVLNKIYTFMKSNQEDDIKHQELQNNRREEELLESDKKHKELLAALAKLTGNKVEGQTANKVESESPTSILDSILDALGGMRVAFNVLRGLAGFLANPVTFILAGGALLSVISTSIATDPNFQQAFTKEMDPNGMLGAMSDGAGLASSILGAAAKTKEEKISIDKKNEVLRTLLKDAPWYTRLYNVGVRDYLLKEKKLTAKQVDELIGPIPTSEEDTGTEVAPTPKPKPMSGASPAEATQARSDFAKTDPRMIGSATEAEAASGASANLVNATNENNNLKLNELTSTPATTNINSSTTNSRKISQSSGALPPVRNLEETFQRMILNSTRVV